MATKKPTKQEREQMVRRAEEAGKRAAEDIVAAESQCAVTRDEFRRKGPVFIPVTIDGQAMSAERKEFSTGSFGWHASGKLTVMIDGKPVKVQTNLSFVIVGSKTADAS